MLQMRLQHLLQMRLQPHVSRSVPPATRQCFSVDTTTLTSVALCAPSCRVMVQPHFNARADLVRLLERRMLQLVGAGLRCASSCCTLPPLAGYRLDRLKQDFAVRRVACRKGITLAGKRSCLQERRLGQL
jgi:hypothetical protein